MANRCRLVTALATGFILLLIGGLALMAFEESALASGRPDLPRPPARHETVPPAGPEGTPPQDPPALPDLSVLYISRTPRYQAYKVDYPGGIPTQRAGTEDAKRRPEAGETVTLTAVVKNQGTVPSPPTDYRWMLDGATTETGSLPALAAGEMVTLTTAWNWEELTHEFAFAVDTADTITEISEENNRRSHQTDALFFAIDAHPYVYEEFARRPNLVGSWSFEDWIQAQVAQMNERLAEAVYPLSPDGVLDRLRIDLITLLAEEQAGGDGGVEQISEFDGHWAFGVAEDDHHTEIDESRESAVNYTEAYAGQIDWGLVHELTHQLGVIDLYRLSLDAAVGNPLIASDGRRLLLGHHWPNPGRMGGGDTSPYNDGTYYSSHTARGLNSHAGYRRGYYGDYLFDLPDQISLHLMDNRGQPAAGARIDIFQTDGNRLGMTPVMGGTTDTAGNFTLPARPIAGGGITTATGHTLKANPFGLIDVVGTNGLLLARIRSDATPPHEEYHWIELTDLNLAYWAGQTDAYTITLNTQYPASDAPPAPALHGDVEGNTIRLHWRSVSVESATYRVYRAFEPEFRYEFLADAGDALAFTDTLTTTAWYAVTADDAAGRESPFSPIARGPLLVRPISIAIDPATHEEIILDQHSGGLFHRESDGDWIGRMGSQHLGLVGARGMSASPDGLTTVAAGGRRVVTLAADRHMVSQFRLGTDDVNPDAYAGDVLLAGEAPGLSQRPTDDARSLFMARFDGDADSHDQSPAVAEALAFIPGEFGQALRMNRESRLAYAPAPEGPPLFMPVAGGVEFWLRPHWPARDWIDHVLLDIGDGETYRFLLVKGAGAGLYVWVEDYDEHHSYAATDVREWKAEEWHHLAVTWNAERLDLTVDGRLQDTHHWRHAITGTVASMWIGTDRDGEYPAEADYDELRISDFARWDTTDESRLVVANTGQQRLQVFDLLGNPISEYGEEGDGVGQFRQPAGLAWVDPFAHNTLLVVDQGNGRIQQLHFDGDMLSHPTIAADGFGMPAAVAVGPDGTLLVSDMARDSVSLVNDQRSVIQEWTEPTDGHAGAFVDPRGLAVRVDGSVLVADGGNRRVVAIRGAFPRRLYCPLLARGG